jgi:hypothetical protein
MTYLAIQTTLQFKQNRSLPFNIRQRHRQDASSELFS